MQNVSVFLGYFINRVFYTAFITHNRIVYSVHYFSPNIQLSVSLCYMYRITHRRRRKRSDNCQHHNKTEICEDENLVTVVFTYYPLATVLEGI